MGDATFEQIAEEILKIKQRMEELQMENEDLRQQLADLREGRGIFVDILGQRFALIGETVVFSPTTSAADDILAFIPESESIAEAPTMAISELSMPEAEEAEQTHGEELDETVLVGASTFLEEILVDEFAEASTNSVAVWEEPDTQKRRSIKDIDEDQKAALRKALVGSFLLE